MRRFLNKKTIAAAVAVVGILGGAGASYAYFTSTGSSSDSGTGSVGTSTAWLVTAGTSTGTMYPGAGTVTFNYTVKNNGSGNRKVTSAVVSVATDSSSPALAVNSSGTAIPGCQAGWFSVDNTNAAAAADLGPAATETGSAAVSMTNAGTSQDGCKNASPKLTVTVI